MPFCEGACDPLNYYPLCFMQNFDLIASEPEGSCGQGKPESITPELVVPQLVVSDGHSSNFKASLNTSFKCEPTVPCSEFYAQCNDSTTSVWASAQINPLYCAPQMNLKKESSEEEELAEEILREVQVTARALALPLDPGQWEGAQVLRWLRCMQQRHQLPDVDTDSFRDVSGAQLLRLSKADMTSLTIAGDVLHAQLGVWKNALRYEQSKKKRVGTSDVTCQQHADVTSPELQVDWLMSRRREDSFSSCSSSSFGRASPNQQLMTSAPQNQSMLELMHQDTDMSFAPQHVLPPVGLCQPTCLYPSTQSPHSVTGVPANPSCLRRASPNSLTRLSQSPSQRFPNSPQQYTMQQNSCSKQVPCQLQSCYLQDPVEPSVAEHLVSSPQQETCYTPNLPSATRHSSSPQHEPGYASSLPPIPQPGTSPVHEPGHAFSSQEGQQLHQRRAACNSTHRRLGYINKSRRCEPGCERDPMRSDLDRPIHLWEFLLDLLETAGLYSTCIRWLDRQAGVFKIEDSVQVAKLWGRRKNRPAMNYDKLSRSVRQYYKKGIIMKTGDSKRLIYKFGSRFCPK